MLNNPRIRNPFLFRPNIVIGTKTLVFWGKPHPKERPRKSRAGFLYDPPANKKAEGDLVRSLAENYPEVPNEFIGPIQILTYFMYPKPKAWFPGKIKSRPDVDNLIKTVCDAFNSVLWKDDGQIIGKQGEKGYWDEPEAATIVKIIYYHPVF